MDRIHLIGFSLGAEVAGFAGKMLKEWNLELPRITGEKEKSWLLARCCCICVSIERNNRIYPQHLFH